MAQTPAVLLIEAADDLIQAADDLIQGAVNLADGNLANGNLANGNFADGDAQATPLDELATTLARRATTLARRAIALAKDATTLAQAAIALAQAVTTLAQTATALADDVAPAKATALEQAATALCLAQDATALAQAVKTLAQDATALFVRLLRCCKNVPNAQITPQFPNVDPKIIRELIMQENTLLDQRRSHFALLQGLLWASAALLVQSDAKTNADLVYIVVGAGALLSLGATFSLQVSNLAIKRLLQIPHKITEPVIGLGPDADLNIFEDIICRWNNPSIVPATIFATWVAFATRLHFKDTTSDPMEIAIIGNWSDPIEIVALIGK